MSNEEFRMPFTVHLVGPAVDGHRLSLEQLTLFAGQLQIAIHRIGRVLSGETFSLMPGPIPKGVRQACTLEVVAIRPGSLSLVCDLPTRMESSLLEESALLDDAVCRPERELGESALEAFVEGVSVVGNDLSDLPRGFDKGVLLALRECGKLFSLGISSIDFDLDCKNGKVINSCYTAEVNQRVISRIHGPVVNKAVIVGLLLMGDFRDKSYACRIHPNVGKPIRCIFDEEQKEGVLAAMTRRVRLVGEAVEDDHDIKSFKIEDIEILDTENFVGGLELHPFFDSQSDLDALIKQQGVQACVNLEEFKTDLWLEEADNPDEFIATIRRWRQEDLPSAS